MKELSLREERIVASLIAGQTKAQTARDVGVAESTIYHVVRRPHVEARLQFLKQEADSKRKAAIDYYNDLVFESLQELSMLAKTAEKDSDKIKARTFILSNAPMFKDKLEIKIATSPLSELASKIDSVEIKGNDKPFPNMRALEISIDRGLVIPEGEEYEESTDSE